MFADVVAMSALGGAVLCLVLWISILFAAEDRPIVACLAWNQGKESQG
ncbi:MAG: hypothetical protein JEY79_14415 [Pseudodesulfovibrio sp.]|nr:hypothetical protein [Pseudodesulfovibrio sp.]